MSIFRRNAKRDDNEQAVVERLRQLGAQVFRLSGAGIPDLLVSWRGISRLAEVKGPKGRMLPAQVKFHKEWTAEPIPILTGPDDATEWLLSLRKAAAREAAVSNHHHEAMKTLEGS